MTLEIRYDPTSYFTTARWTLRAIIPTLLGRGEIFDEEPPTDDHWSWATRFVQNINDTELSWHVQCDAWGIVVLTRSVSFLANGVPMNHAVRLEQWDLKLLTRESFSSLISEAIIGLGYVPMTSRKEAKEVWTIAQQDAEYVFQVGMRRILSKGVGAAGWTEGEVGEQWDAIHSAAQDVVGHPLADHKSVLRKAGVVAFSMDVYNDSFQERAYELMRPMLGGGL